MICEIKIAANAISLAPRACFVFEHFPLCTWSSGVRFTKVFRTELGHKYILVECSVIALCLPVVSKLSRYKRVCYK